MEVKVSVIVPVYNVEQYLEKCLQSIIYQTFKEIEIIIINDGSTDGSAEIIQQYLKKEPRIILIEQENRGLSGARNVGLSKAKGDYILFVDSDDYLHEECVEKLYRYAEDGKVDTVMYSADIFTDVPNHERYLHERNNEIWERRTCLNEVHTGKELFVQMIKSNKIMPAVQIQMFRSGFLKENGMQFSEGYILEDNAFNFAVLMKAKRAMCVEDKLYFRRIREGSIITTRQPTRMFQGRFAAYVDIIGHLPQDENNEELFQCIQMFVKRYLNSARMEYRNLTEEEKMQISFGNNMRYSILFQELVEGDVPNFNVNAELKTKVAVFGAGGIGAHFLDVVGSDKVEVFIDNHKTGQYCGKPVISLKEYIDGYLGLPIVIATKYYVDITAQLKRNGIGNLTKYVAEL